MKLKPFRLFIRVIRRCHFEKLLAGFLLVFFLGGLLVTVVEPGIHRYGDGLWYMFVACTTIGFGDITAVTFLGRATTVAITIYEIVLVAILSGVVVSYYLELVRRTDEETIGNFLDKMEHLTELSREELLEMQEKIKRLRR